MSFTNREGNLIMNPVSRLVYWRMIQVTVWCAGLFIFGSLIFYPSLGLMMFWNILIPVAPALLLVSTGLWRNICPLAVTALIPRHFNFSKRKKMNPGLQVKLQFISIIALFAIVPLRHAVFNRNGMATAILLSSLAITAFVMGTLFDWKSGWCSSLCPVHPVEKLYGGNPLFTLPNAHCSNCVNCSVPCPDSTPGIHPAITEKNSLQKINGILIIGGLPGFIWGWFHVPDYTGKLSIAELVNVYKMPLTGCCAGLIIYLLLRVLMKGNNRQLLINLFAAAAVSCYYWYRLPSLFGFGKFEEDGVLVNLKNIIPEWYVSFAAVCLLFFFFYRMLFRGKKFKSWVIRPAFAARESGA